MKIENSLIARELSRRAKVLPTHPETSRISHRMYDLVKQSEAQYGAHYADFNVLNLVASSTSKQFRAFEINQNLGVKYLDDVTHEPIYTFFGKNEVVKTATTLLEQCIDEGLKPELKMVPEETIFGLEKEMNELFNIEEDRDNFEYVYDLHELGYSRDKKIKTVTKYADRFLKNYVNRISFVPMRRSKRTSNFIDRSKYSDMERYREQFQGILDNWQETKNLPELEINRIKRSIDRFTKLSPYFDMRNAGLFVDGQLAAFSFNEVLDDENILSHFAFAKTGYSGIMQYFDRRLAQRLEEEGFKYMNLQQDLGKPGIRQSKLSYNPCRFNRKIKISPKQQ